MKLTKNINSRSILLNILNPKISTHIIDEWLEIFFTLFSYYPFKKLLLATYIKNFSILYDGEEVSLNRGSSISCQLLTSYQLVRDYAL
jgi:hypothetical protein